MENSAKFLYMVGGILIALSIIAIGVYIFTTGASMTAQYDQKLSDEELKVYNAEFERYVTEKDDKGKDEYIWQATDIATLINKSYDINQKENENGGNEFITIEIYMTSSKYAEYTLDKSIEKIGVMKDRYDKECSIYDFIKSNTNLQNPNNVNDYYSNKFSCSIESYHSSGKVEKMKFICKSEK